MSKLILLSGKKGSGKSTLGKYAAEKLSYLGFSTKVYNFADSLKQFCVDYLYLDPKLVWGSDKDKETITSYHWEDLPHYQDILKRELDLILENPSYSTDCIDFPSFIRNKFSGAMTIRQVLQEWGTGVFRKLNNVYWVHRTLRQIQQDKNDVSIICDTRFPNEVIEPKSIFGSENILAVRLTRNVKGSDSHPSETALDDYPFDVVINNQEQRLETSQDVLMLELNNWLSG